MTTELARAARHSDALAAKARAQLVQAVRRASAEGLTQAQIAREIGRSQPEVSRLLRFHGTSPLARTLRRNADEVRRIIAESGGDRVRVFGSLATEQDGPTSDVDLLFAMRKPLSLMQLSGIEQRLADLLGSSVDLVPESALRPDLRERVLAESVAL